MKKAPKLRAIKRSIKSLRYWCTHKLRTVNQLHVDGPLNKLTKSLKLSALPNNARKAHFTALHTGQYASQGPGRHI